MFNGYRKALTFSFDDGVEDDVRLIEIMNRYGLKGTFNLNSGVLSDMGSWRFNDVKDVHRINITEHPHLYDGHEVACHTVTHGCLTQHRYESVYNEFYLDKLYLGALFGYEIKGSALPYGAFNDDVVKVLYELDIRYSRTTRNTNGFGFPKELPLLDPTCHFMGDTVNELADRFLADEGDGDMLFNIWGHSYELVTDEEWEQFEKLCEKLSGRSDVYYCTNIEAIEGYGK